MIGALLERMVKVGDLTVRLPGGSEVRAGDGSGRPVVIRLSRKGLQRIVANPSLGLAEAYMDEDMVLETGDIWDLLEIVGRSGGRGPKGRGSAAKRAKKAVEPGAKKSSGLSAAHQVLTDAGEPMRCGDMVEKMLSSGLWKTNGKTPAATIYAAIVREISTKGTASRFRKTDRGLFTVAAN